MILLKYFSFIQVLRNKVCLVVPSIVGRNVFCDIFKINCHEDFKFSSIISHKQRKQTAKYQNFGICLLNYFQNIIVSFKYR